MECSKWHLHNCSSGRKQKTAEKYNWLGSYNRSQTTCVERKNEDENNGYNCPVIEYSSFAFILSISSLPNKFKSKIAARNQTSGFQIRIWVRDTDCRLAIPKNTIRLVRRSWTCWHWIALLKSLSDGAIDSEASLTKCQITQLYFTTRERSHISRKFIYRHEETSCYNVRHQTDYF